MPAAAVAQTDYYNLDAGRPVRVEDAFPVERNAFELQAAPLRVERHGAGRYTWTLEPELAWGVLPRLQVEAGVPIVRVDVRGGGGAGVAGIEASALYNLNAETATLPAMAIAAEAVFPVGRHGPAEARVSAKGILTRTWRIARVHLNGAYTFGAAPATAEDAGSEEAARWEAGIAADRALPLEALLLVGEVTAREPLGGGETIWRTGAGVRVQLSPRLALDGGLGRMLTGAERSWEATIGAAWVFAIRSLIPGVREGDR